MAIRKDTNGAKPQSLVALVSPVTLAGNSNSPDALLRIVGIGASAGGLEAFERFFRACPVDTGMAFVLVSHLDPNHESLLTEILQRSTAMLVVEALDQIAIVSNHIYVIPPNCEMTIFQGVLQLSVPEQARGQRMPIDIFLRSLAEDQAENAIGIILSGTGTDGTAGLCAISDAGGICMVQDPSTAKYDGMPKSAITASHTTHILPVDKMPTMLLELTRQSVSRQRGGSITTEKAVSDLNQILLQLYNGTGHDFSLYKKSTIGRCIERRMVQHNIRDLGGYACYLKEHPLEVQRLFKQLLINVTSFFRNPEAFVALKREILPQLLADKPTNYVLRVWVAACATGEEAYSIAMLLREFMDESHKEFGIQIYATDINNDAIDVARTGSYPLSIVQDVTSERLHRFFIKDDAGYKVKKDIRDMVVFAVQSAIKHPPFAELDLFSCRNLLIYLEQEQQNRLISTFHHALKPGGVLFLSPSENITNRSKLFSVLNHKWKLYQVNHTAAVSHTTLSESFSRINSVSRIPDMGVISETKADNIANLSKRILLRSYAPASVTTDIKGKILYTYGDTGKYLRPPSGTATNNVIEMAHEGLQLELRAALLNAAAENVPTLNRVVSVKTNDGFSPVSFSVRLLPSYSASEIAGESLLLMSFQETAELGTKQGRGKRSAALAEAGLVERLEHVLAYIPERVYKPPSKSSR